MLVGINKIPFSQPFLGKSEVDEVDKVLMSGWLTTGKLNEEFEKKFADYVGAKYCVLVNSCTAALFLSIKYLQSKNPNLKTVYLPSFTFAATATEAIHAGLDVTFGDVSVEDGCLLPTFKGYDLAIPVHYAGNEANVKMYNPKTLIIEDSAHRIDRGQCRNNKNLVCFSFYATKNLTMGEGGAICTNDEEAYNWLKQARHHGISKDGWNRYGGGGWRYEVEFIGWKANLSDIQAAIGLHQLDKMEEMDNRRKHIIEYYNKELGYKNEGLHLYPIIVENRNEFIENMKKVGIQTSVHFLPLHQMKAFKDIKKEELNFTEYLGERIVSLPLYPGLSDEMIEYICQMTKKFT
jgi:dTDP-4-amino-4,6-dideoxygalactose transaminase